MPPLLAVRNMAGLLAATAQAERDVDRGVRAGMRDVARPVQHDAQAFIRSAIPTIGADWNAMRIGVTRRSVYVAPRKRGVSRRSPRSRPNLARLMQPEMDRAAVGNEAEARRRFEDMLDTMANRFNRS